MNLIELVLGLIVGLAVAGLAKSQSLSETGWPISSYLTKRYLNQNDELALDWIKQKVDGQSFASVEETRQFLKQCQQDLYIYGGPMNSTAANNNLQVLIDLAESRPECTMELITRYIAIADLLYGGLDMMAQADSVEAHSGGLFDYLHSLGRDNLTKCWRDQKSKKLNHPKAFDGRTEKAFDEVVLSQAKWTAHQSRDKINNQHIAQVARTINLLGFFDGQAMLRAAQKYSLFGNRIERLPSTYLIQSLIVYCSRLSTDYELLLSSYNLSRLWSSTTGVGTSSSTDRLVKLNEFARLCHQLLNPDTTIRAQANIQRLL